jgi:hypothetical protein
MTYTNNRPVRAMENEDELIDREMFHLLAVGIHCPFRAMVFSV